MEAELLQWKQVSLCQHDEPSHKEPLKLVWLAIVQLGPHGSTALGACGGLGGLGGLRGLRELGGLGGLGGRGCARRELRGGSREEGAERSSEVGCVVVFWALFQAHSRPFPLLEESHFQPFSQDGHSLVVSTSV